MSIATEFKDACEEYGFAFCVRGRDNNIVSISRKFTPESLDEFTACDVDYPSVTCTLPRSGGSVWGTDGGGMGAMQALRTGVFVINVSGVRASVIKELVK